MSWLSPPGNHFIVSLSLKFETFRQFRYGGLDSGN
jgi:hypothetical protein